MGHHKSNSKIQIPSTKSLHKNTNKQEKLKIPHTSSDLTAHLKVLEQKEVTTHNRIR